MTGWQPIAGYTSVTQKLNLLSVLPINLSTWNERSKMMKRAHYTYLTTKLLAAIYFRLFFYPTRILFFYN